MKENVQDIWIDRVGLLAIVLVSLGYVLFGSPFAQLRLELHFLNFPIFIGEILLGFTSLLFIVKNMRQKWELGRWGWILGAYFLFVLLKAFSGYMKWGPLAFRDAALFYYPFFTVLGYSFWSDALGGENTRRTGVAVILLIFIFHQISAFWPCTLIIIGVILSLRAKNFPERIIVTAAIFIFAPYWAMFNLITRTDFLSLSITGLFIAVIFFLWFCRDRRARIVGAVLGCLILGTSLYEFGQTGMGKTFVPRDVEPWAAISSQEPPPGKYLFHPVGGSSGKDDTIKEFFQRISRGCLLKKTEKNIPVGEKREGKSIIEIKKDDTRFRYYIWRDMVHEYARYKPFFGFDFGRPLISLTMKYYGLPATEDRDGWIGAHNSFLYMMYRAGIVGLAMVLFLFYTWFGLLRDFYIVRDWTGLLLCAVLLNWFVSANFFLIFELPFTAIPVWTILGVTLKHRVLHGR